MKIGLAPPEDLQTVDELEAYLKEFEAHVRKLDTPILGGPRRHHYIPQFYLRRFANNGKRLIRMPLPAHPPPSRKPTNVTNVAVMKDFYTVLTAKGESAIIENLLGVWDHDASECFKKLTDKDAWPISANLKLRMCFWFGLLSVRSPYFRRNVEALTDYLVEFTNKNRKEDTAPIESKSNLGSPDRFDQYDAIHSVSPDRNVDCATLASIASQLQGGVAADRHRLLFGARPVLPLYWNGNGQCSRSPHTVRSAPPAVYALI